MAICLKVICASYSKWKVPEVIVLLHESLYDILCWYCNSFNMAISVSSIWLKLPRHYCQQALHQSCTAKLNFLVKFHSVQKFLYTWYCTYITKIFHINKKRITVGGQDLYRNAVQYINNFDNDGPGHKKCSGKIFVAWSSLILQVSYR